MKIQRGASVLLTAQGIAKNSLGGLITGISAISPLMSSETSLSSIAACPVGADITTLIVRIQRGTRLSVAWRKVFVH